MVKGNPRYLVAIICSFFFTLPLYAVFIGARSYFNPATGQAIIIFEDQHLYKLDTPYGNIQRKNLIDFAQKNKFSLLIEDSSEDFKVEEARKTTFAQESPLRNLAQSCKEEEIKYENVEFRNPFYEREISLNEKNKIIADKINQLYSLKLLVEEKGASREAHNFLNDKLKIATLFQQKLVENLSKNLLVDSCNEEWVDLIKITTVKSMYKEVPANVQSIIKKDNPQYLLNLFESLEKIALSNLIDASFLLNILQPFSNKIICAMGQEHAREVPSILEKEGFALKGQSQIEFDEESFEDTPEWLNKMKIKYPALQVGSSAGEKYPFIAVNVEEFLAKNA